MNNRIWAILKFVKDKLVWVLPAAMGLGLVLGSSMDMRFLKGGILPLTILMVLPMMVNLRWRSLFGRDGGRVFLVTSVLNFTVVPTFAFFIGRHFFPDDPAAVTGMVLIGVLPTSGMTLSWTGFSGGNVKAALRNVLIFLPVGALLLPLYLRTFLGEAARIPVGRLLEQIGLVILLPMVVGGFVGGFLRRRMGTAAYDGQVKPKMPLVSSAAVVLMVFSAMALKARSIMASPEILLISLAALAAFYLLLFAAGHVLGRVFLGREDALAMVFSSAVRNLSVALALSFLLLGEKSGSASLLASLAFPLQVQMAAWYAKLAGVTPTKDDCSDCPEEAFAASA